MPELSAFELEVAIEKLKRYKSPSIDQIPAELFKNHGVGQFTLRYTVFINSIFNKEELSEEWSRSLYKVRANMNYNSKIEQNHGFNLLN